MRNQRITGRMSQAGRQVDVWAAGFIAGVDVNVAIECKRYSRPVNVGTVDEFAGKLQDLNADRGILYSYSGFTSSAVNRAALSSSPRIQAVGLLTLDPEPDHDGGPLYAESQTDPSAPSYYAPLTEDLSVDSYARFLASGEWVTR
jgi:hypothetical protein